MILHVALDVIASLLYLLIDIRKRVIVKKEKKIKRLVLIGAVEPDMAKEALYDLLEHDWVNEKIDELQLVINSEGGFITDCFAMIDMIELLKNKFNFTISTIGTGMIASAGFFLFLLGDTRTITPNCRAFVHEHITIEEAEKTYSERIRSDKTDQKNIYNMYINYTKRRLGLTARQAKLLLRKNKWLSAKEISNFGIVTKETV